jgi:hypothetical protein
MVSFKFRPHLSSDKEIMKNYGVITRLGGMEWIDLAQDGNR